jgi:two-component system, sensor histidine kinase RpfC
VAVKGHFVTEFATKMRRVLGVYQTRVRDPDIEQAWLRIGICLLAFGYVWYLIISEGTVTPGFWMGLFASVGDIAVAAYMIWRLRQSKPPVVSLRYLGILADNTALTIGMAGAGEGGVAMIGVYLWVTIGNGFRFGPRYLLAAYWLSIIGFGLQLTLVPFWEQHRVVGAGLFLAGAIVPLYVLVLLIRLTSQKDAAEQLSNAKSRFVANVSHELRTPLTGIFAVYDLLRSRKISSDDRELVSMLGNAVRTLKTSVDAVLQMSKLEAGAERAEQKVFNLWFFAQQLGASVQAQSALKGLTWSLQIDADVPFNVTSDPIHLSHVLGNLLNNAFKFTSKGGITLRIENCGEGRVRFEVIDTGIGIPLSQQERLFERFVQVDSSSKRKFGGTGLGTSIARDLTELMGGTINVLSAPGQGSTFRVELPMLSADAASQEIDWGTWRRVLVIGEPSIEREAIVQSLQMFGLEANLAPVPKEDPSIFDSQKYLAALLLMSAPEAANLSEKLLRDRSGIACPWIVISHFFSDTQRASLIAGGAAALLNAGCSAEILRMALGSLINRLEFSTYTAADLTGSSNTKFIRPLSLLLADDNASNRMLISRILTGAGYNVREAERGDQAFDIMASEKLDIALLDLNMPDMSGPDVVKLFRAGSVGGDRLPIIILSADATPAAKQESLEAGANEFVTKPVTSQALLATIERVIGGTSPRPFVAIGIGQSGAKSLTSNVPQLIDAEQIQSLRRIARNDQNFLDRYIAAAFSELEQAILDLRDAAAKNNVRDARSALHIIEGTGGSIGATALVSNCKSMRTYVAVPEDPDCAGALAELSTTMALTKSAVLAVIHDPPKAAGYRVGSSH